MNTFGLVLAEDPSSKDREGTYLPASTAAEVALLWQSVLDQAAESIHFWGYGVGFIYFLFISSYLFMTVNQRLNE